MGLRRGASRSDDPQDNDNNLAALSEEAIRAEIEARARPASAGPKALFTGPDEAAFDGVDTGTLIKALRHKQRVVYGVDDRKDYYEIDSMGAKANADSVVALFDEGDVIDQGDGTSRLAVETFKSAYRLATAKRLPNSPAEPPAPAS
jgi:hypothetical protein